MFIGAFLVLAYNLELAGGRFHTDLWFALAWGAFPAFTGYFVMALRIDAPLTGEDAELFEGKLYDGGLVIGIVDFEITRQPQARGFTPQQPGTKRVERADPGQP